MNICSVRTIYKHSYSLYVEEVLSNGVFLILCMPKHQFRTPAIELESVYSQLSYRVLVVWLHSPLGFWSQKHQPRCQCNGLAK